MNGPSTGAPDSWREGQSWDEEYLANSYDDIFLKTVTAADKARVIVPEIVAEKVRDDYRIAEELDLQLQHMLADVMKASHGLSDHLPIWVTVSA